MRGGAENFNNTSDADFAAYAGIPGGIQFISWRGSVGQATWSP